MIYLPTVHPTDRKRPIGEYEIIPADYEVKINGQPLTVQRCRVSAMPFNCVWPGHQRDKSQSELASFINFYGDEEVTVEIKVLREFKRCVVRPLSKGIKPAVQGDTATFTLKTNGNYVFELDDTHFALHIFYNVPKEHPEKENATYYFGPGVHKPLMLTLKSNDTVYIHPEAVVFTTVYADGAENIRIYGGGILDNSCQERVDSHCLGNSPIGNIRIYNSKNIRVEDVILRDSANWICCFFNCDNIYIDNIKLVGHWRYNTDGIDMTNTSNVVIKNCFIRSFDDSICVKAANDYTVCENVHVENCVCWCDWGKSLEIGLETAADEYRNITYKNCDLIHNISAALAVSNGHYADIHDVHYEDISIEFQNYREPPVYQDYDAMEYDDGGKICDAIALRIENLKMSAIYNETPAGEKDAKYGISHDISYKNIHIFCDEGMDKIKLEFNSLTPEAPIYNVSIENLTLNGAKMTDFGNFDVTDNNLKDIYLDGKKIY